ncbi:CopG family transcriptional regulator [Escherichia albertii]|nr:CopG family transcriptional regulator [Escherichia albertii]MCQ8935428.1 ribbon-helix-helix domain-containing protein [Escherichia albertii]UUL07773.1 ribbon-helix-helix domain-containing protein [Escherichia albertii]HEB1564539.1 CopG family transcriptional regulator [Escherichia albertii]HEB1607074.1 CopG family transcriptional regulator [Escherichia albertii]
MNTVFLHLSEEAIKRLNKLRGWRKVSRSAILREAVDQYLENQSKTTISSALGIWQGCEEDGVEYQRKLREEW